jgi:uncharacterized protein (TIGR04255 family)
VLSRDESVTVTVSEGGVQGTQTEVTWRFSDADKKWRVSLASNFIALETEAYASRADFIERYGEVLRATAKYIEPTFVTRIGLRYIDQIHGEPLSRIETLIRPELLALVGTSLRQNIKRTMSQVICDTAEGRLIARWGLQPRNTTHDPGMVKAIGEESWILDFDVFDDVSRKPHPFDTAELEAILMQLASRAYTFFRWAVTPSFIQTYGGSV